MNALTFPAPSRRLHTDPAITLARDVARRRRGSTCEIYAPGDRAYRPLGSAAPADKFIGRVRCSVTQAVRPSERGQENDAVVTATEYEFVFGRGTKLAPNYRLAVPLRPPVWTAGAKAKNAVVAPTTFVSGETPYFLCVKPGISAAIEPLWPEQAGQVVTDGTVVWKHCGYARMFEVMAVNASETQNVEIIVRARELESS